MAEASDATCSSRTVAWAPRAVFATRLASASARADRSTASRIFFVAIMASSARSAPDETRGRDDQTIEMQLICQRLALQCRSLGSVWPRRMRPMWDMAAPSRADPQRPIRWAGRDDQRPLKRGRLAECVTGLSSSNRLVLTYE